VISTAHIEAAISDQSLTDILSGLVDIASPTGEEAALAAHITEQLKRFGITASTQETGGSQANAIGRMNGASATGKSLLLYAPMDTVTSNNEDEDIPWAGPELRPDMQAKAFVKNGHIYGLGAHNPKGHAACILEAGRVLKQLDVTPEGDIHFGFGAGGMPTHGRAGFPRDSGHGTGCAHMIKQLPKIDGAIIAKSGTSVTWEEVGFIWLEVTVAGKHNYVGARHLMPYDNAIANASRLILKIEDWFEDYAQKHATELCRPQGTVSYIQSGWKRMPAFTPAAARFLVDLRFTPQQTPDDVEAEIVGAILDLCKEFEIEARIERIQTIEASHTPPTDPIIQTTIKVWEELKNRPHEPFTLMSGATDANILRRHGIPTARIGLAKADIPGLDFALGMNCAALSEMRHLTKLLVMSALRYNREAAHG